MVISTIFRPQAQPTGPTVSYFYAQPRVGIVVNQHMEIIQVEPDGRGAQAGLAIGDTLIAWYGKDEENVQQTRDHIMYMRGDERTNKKVRH